jgi:hypothetical protein
MTATALFFASGCGVSKTPIAPIGHSATPSSCSLATQSPLSGVQDKKVRNLQNTQRGLQTGFQDKTQTKSWHASRRTWSACIPTSFISW